VRREEDKATINIGTITENDGRRRGGKSTANSEK